MLSKNEIITLEITDLTNEGNGVGRYDGIAIFVPDTAVGDIIKCKIVKVNKSYCYGIADEYLEYSKTRIEDDCCVYKKCGGCSFRHISYEEECRVKDKFIKDSFQRIGKLSPEYDEFTACSSTDGYRNKAQYPVAEQDGKAVCGFYSRRSHRVADCCRCKLQPEIFGDIIFDIMQYVNANHISAYNEITHAGILRHIYLRRGEHTGEIMVCLIITDLKKKNLFSNLFDLLINKFADIKTIVLNENNRNTNIILGTTNEIVYGNKVITDTMCGNRIEISPLSFYQVNTLQAEKLYSIAADYADLKGNETLLDLYCGAGTIGLSMASRINKLIGVEIIQSATDNAIKNAAINGIDNAEFICGDAGETAKLLFERGITPDVIIADPARKGCDKQTIDFMAAMNPAKIVMISCNHTTAARDCAALKELGYDTVRVCGVDMFPRTTHVESVVLMSKVQK